MFDLDILFLKFEQKVYDNMLEAYKSSWIMEISFLL